MIKKIGIVGGSGYTGGELIRILINHPNVEIDFVYSRTNDGKKIQDVHSDLIGKDLPHFSKKVNKNIKRILEIGTFNAQNAYLLSVLFQNAQVTTVDLPNDSDDYKNTYKRDEKTKLKAFLEERSNRINKRENLKLS